MKKVLATFLSFALSCSLFSQVGINTQTPKATLDVSASADNLSKTDGIIPPRLTGDQLKAKDALYEAEETGTIVYATQEVTQPSPKTANVVMPGFYYFDGNIWNPLKAVTGNVMFSAKMGVGNGEQINATLPANTWSTVPLATVDVNIGGGIWNSDNTYTVPVSGTYMINSTVRLTDNTVPNADGSLKSPSRNIFQNVHTANLDTPHGVWYTNPDRTTNPQGSGYKRFTMPYARVGYFLKGARLRLYIRSDGVAANIANASLNIVLISQN